MKLSQFEQKYVWNGLNGYWRLLQGDHSKFFSIPYILPYMNLIIPYIPYSKYRTFFKIPYILFKYKAGTITLLYH